jgi:hypothetical protein
MLIIPSQYLAENQSSMEELKVPNLTIRKSENNAHLWKKIMPNRNYRIGSTVHKKSKYNTSSNYFCLHSPKGKRSLLSSTHSANAVKISTEEIIIGDHTAWILCERNFVPKSQKRKVNPNKPSPKHKNLASPKSRRWPTAILSTFQAIIRNDYVPLRDFTHHEELDMARDRAQAAAATRVCMGRLRSGSMQPTLISISSGRTGGGYGRGDANTANRRDNNKYKSQQADEQINKATTTDETSTGKQDKAQTISD